MKLSSICKQRALPFDRDEAKHDLRMDWEDDTPYLVASVQSWSLAWRALSASPSAGGGFPEWACPKSGWSH